LAPHTRVKDYDETFRFPDRNRFTALAPVTHLYVDRNNCVPPSLVPPSLVPPPASAMHRQAVVLAALSPTGRKTIIVCSYARDSGYSCTQSFENANQALAYDRNVPIWQAIAPDRTGAWPGTLSSIGSWRELTALSAEF
jgi:hypothetical protein